LGGEGVPLETVTQTQGRSEARSVDLSSALKKPKVKPDERRKRGGGKGQDSQDRGQKGTRFPQGSTTGTKIRA